MTPNAYPERIERIVAPNTTATTTITLERM